MRELKSEKSYINSAVFSNYASCIVMNMLVLDKKHRTLGFLKQILSAPTNEKRRNLLAIAPDTVIRLICEICLNLIKQTLPIDIQKVKKLRKYRNLVTRLSKQSATVDSKRRIIIQEGGAAFIVPLLSAAAGK
jgi:hypothetical protein